MENTEPQLLQKPVFSQKPSFKRKEIKSANIYSKSLITRSISLPMSSVGKNIFENIEKMLAFNYEGKCQVEGFIKQGSIKLITHSSGTIQATNVAFEAVFECQICCPVEGMLIQCIAKNITKAGIRAESVDEIPSPILVFVTRDHHYMNKYFSSITENDTFIARVIGQRFELNDKYVSIIAELVNPREEDKKNIKKPRLVIQE